METTKQAISKWLVTRNFLRCILNFLAGYHFTLAQILKSVPVFTKAGKCINLVLILLLSGICACNSPSTQPENISIQDTSGIVHPTIYTNMPQESPEVIQLRSEVLAIHDDIMPAMDEIMQLRREINTELIRLDQVNTTHFQKDIQTKQQLEMTMKALYQADKAMMHWMHNYNRTLENTSDQEKQAALGTEKTKIIQVKQQMLAGIYQARKMRNKYR